MSLLIVNQDVEPGGGHAHPDHAVHDWRTNAAAMPVGKRSRNGVLGGAYDGDNLGTISFDERIKASVQIAQQIAGLRDGASTKLSLAGERLLALDRAGPHWIGSCLSWLKLDFHPGMLLC